MSTRLEVSDAGDLLLVHEELYQGKHEKHSYPVAIQGRPIKYRGALEIEERRRELENARVRRASRGYLLERPYPAAPIPFEAIGTATPEITECPKATNRRRKCGICARMSHEETSE